MIVGLASPRIAANLDEGLEKVRTLLSVAASRGAELVCFPEAYLPGLRGQGFAVPPFGPDDLERVLRTVSQWSRDFRVATILGSERLAASGRQIAAYVFDERGEVLGFQTKNQIDPTEDPNYVPGSGRRLFEVHGVKFGITICHEGWRYPETVRWAAVRGARIVFHPQLTGSDREGVVRMEWGSPGPYYEKAMMCRALENTVYFASVNYAMRFQESATSLIGPSGECQAYLPYGEEGVLVQEIDLHAASGLLAERFAPERHGDLAREEGPDSRP